MDALDARGGVYVCCSVLQCVAVCCSVLQCVAVCCGNSAAIDTLDAIIRERASESGRIYELQ